MNVFDNALTAFVPTPVQADAELEHVVVVFRARVDRETQSTTCRAGCRARNRAPSRDSIEIWTSFAVAHDPFINGIIHDLLEQDVATVVGMRAVPMRRCTCPCAAGYAPANSAS